MENQIRSLTRIHRQNIYSYGVAILMFLIVLSALFSCSDADGVKDEVMEYTENFFSSQHSGRATDSIRHAVISGAKMNIGNDSVFYGRMKTICRTMFENGEQVDAIEYLNGLLGILRMKGSSGPDVDFRAYCCLLLGAAYDEVGLSALSHEQYYRGLELIDGGSRKSHDKLRGDFYNNLGVSFFRSGDLERAKGLLDTAMNYALQSNNSYLTSIIHTNLSGIYSEEKDNEKSIDHLLKAIQAIPMKTDDPSAANFGEYYSLQSELGTLYMKNNDMPMAYAYLSNAYRNIGKTDNGNYLYPVAYRLASYFNKAHQPDSADKYMDIAWNAVEKAKNPYHRMSLLQDEMKIAGDNGHYEKAFALSVRVSDLKDSLRSRENLLRMQNAHDAYIADANAMGQKSSDPDFWSVVSLCVMGVVVVALAVGLYVVRDRKRKEGRAYEERLLLMDRSLKSATDDAESAASRLSEANEENARAHEAIRDYSRKLSEANELNEKARQTISDYSRKLSDASEINDKAQETIRDYSQKLSSFTMERLMAAGRLEEIESETRLAMTKLPTREKDAREILNSILAKISVMKTGSQWDDFQQYFENVHPDFYSRLDTTHPNLTAKDRRLCALISLGLSTKDIASITCLETRSVESSRNRLRKKLGLDNDSNLFDYIKSI